ncbi:MAG TPA: aminoglycoside adenylyltransferase domain-containing protein [Acidobacteriota bacterium]|nr:aminoglycoside adenylyltransferase domain-containing protein [Acidobacteriota bacterium]
MSTTSNTPYPQLNAVLQELVSSVQKILREHLVGAYLQGSFAVGDFDEHSDADFVMVIVRELSESQLRDLQSMHERIFNLGPEWAKHLEGSYFPKKVLRDYTQSGSDLWYLDNGSCVLVRSNHCNKIVVRSILWKKGVVLRGPKPSTLIEPIPVAVLRRAILASINESGQLILTNPEQFNNRFYQTFIVLHYCRKLHDLHTGVVGSKRSGAEWAKDNMEQSWSGLIDRAWDGRPNPAVSVRQPADKADYKSTLEFVREVIRAANKFADSERLLKGESD